VRERAEHGPGAVSVEIAGGRVRERLVSEVGDDLLHDGAIAMLGLHEAELGAAKRKVLAGAGVEYDETAVEVGRAGSVRRHGSKLWGAADGSQRRRGRGRL
jgi:hypothetical protein